MPELYAALGIGLRRACRKTPQTVQSILELVPEAGGLNGRSTRSTRYELRLRLAAQIRLFEPELLITFNPVPNFDEYQRGTQHKDHQWIGHEALACFYPIARDHLQFPELWDRTHWPALRRNFSELRSLTDAQFEK